MTPHGASTATPPPISFHRDFDLTRCECSALGIFGPDICPAQPTLLVVLDGWWMGAACCDDEHHGALATRWTLEQFERYGTYGAVRVDDLPARDRK